MEFTRPGFLSLLFLVLILPLPGVHGQVITPKKTREKVAKLATQLETQPLSKKAKNWRRDVLRLMASAPDLRVEPCNSLLGDILLDKQLGSAELRVQLAISAAKALALNPDLANDKLEVYLAGLRGVLSTYRAMRSGNPLIQNEFLDDLITRESQGALGTYVRGSMQDCSRISTQP